MKRKGNFRKPEFKTNVKKNNEGKVDDKPVKNKMGPDGKRSKYYAEHFIT